jgi:hypothetical protein
MKKGDYAPCRRASGVVVFIFDGQVEATVSEGSAGARIVDPRTRTIGMSAALTPIIVRKLRRMTVSPG